MSAATTTSVPDAPLTATPIEVEDDDDDDGPMFNDDGSAVDPDEFRRWLMSNPEKMKELEKEEHKDVAQLLLGGDNAKTQDCLRKMFALQMKHAEEDEQSKMSSPDLLRTECTVPRDPVVLYQQIAQSRAAVRTRVQAPFAGVDPPGHRGRAAQGRTRQRQRRRRRRRRRRQRRKRGRDRRVRRARRGPRVVLFLHTTQPRFDPKNIIVGRSSPVTC